MLQRLLCLTFALIGISQSPGESLERDYSMDRPLLCPTHMKNYSNWFECNGPCEDVSLIPSLADMCDYCACSVCNKVSWTRFADEDGEEADFFWTCLCKWAEPERGWDENMDSWEYCAHPIVYQGYFDRNFRTYSDLLNDHLAYHKENPECLCTWPERSTQAAAISNRAYRLIRNILEHTQLSVLVDNSTEQGQFLHITPRSCRNTHGLTIALMAKCFFFSHYDCVLDDLEKYTKKTFDSNEYRQISSQLDDIRDELCPLFLRLYDDCLTQHPSERINREKDYLLKRIGYDSEFDSYHFTNNGLLNLAFGRGTEEISDLKMASPEYFGSLDTADHYGPPPPVQSRQGESDSMYQNYYPLHGKRHHDLTVQQCAGEIRYNPLF